MSSGSIGQQIHQILIRVIADVDDATGYGDAPPEVNEALDKATSAILKLINHHTAQQTLQARIEELEKSRDRFMPGWERDWFDERLAQLQPNTQRKETE